LAVGGMRITFAGEGDTITQHRRQHRVSSAAESAMPRCVRREGW
jgi:hypothetical protein